MTVKDPTLNFEVFKDAKRHLRGDAPNFTTIAKARNYFVTSGDPRYLAKMSLTPMASPHPCAGCAAGVRAGDNCLFCGRPA